MGEDGDAIENSSGKEIATAEGSSEMEPYVGMQFESEEAAKVFYDAYATSLGFIMRVDAFRRSMRDGKVVWRRLVCNKEGFRKLRPKRSENRKPRAVTREGCKAMIVVKKEKTGQWVVTRFVKEHNHPLVVTPANGRRSIVLSQTPVSANKPSLVVRSSICCFLYQFVFYEFLSCNILCFLITLRVSNGIGLFFCLNAAYNM